MGDSLSYFDKAAKSGVKTERIASDSSATTIITPLATGDDYDTWCEASSTCTRKISSYISETKGNLVYGNQTGSLGSFDVIMRTNLNGRQARWTGTFIRDTGGTVAFSSAHFACTQAWTFDKTCGNHNLDNGDGAFTLSNSYVGPLVYGNKLVESDEYFGETKANFRASSINFVTSPLRSAQFKCYGSDNCYFP